jgi:hypothetical protein
MTGARARIGPSLVTAGVIAVLLLAGCGGASSSPTTTASTTTAPAVTTTTTTTVATTTTTVYAPTDPQSSPDAAAAKLIGDWATGNKAEADQVANPASVSTLFAMSYPTGAVQDRGCTLSSVSPGTCTYRNLDTDGIYEITVTDGPSGWYVSAVTSED